MRTCAALLAALGDKVEAKRLAQRVGVPTIPHWIDTDERDEVERARRTGGTYPAELKVYDQFQDE